MKCIVMNGVHGQLKKKGKWKSLLNLQRNDTMYFNLPSFQLYHHQHPNIDTMYFNLSSFQLYHLQHPNIARFIGVVIENGDNRVLMEYCPRGSLQVFLDQSYQIIHAMICQVCRNTTYDIFQRSETLHNELTMTKMLTC